MGGRVRARTQRLRPQESLAAAQIMAFASVHFASPVAVEAQLLVGTVLGLGIYGATQGGTQRDV